MRLRAAAAAERRRRVLAVEVMRRLLEVQPRVLVCKGGTPLAGTLIRNADRPSCLTRAAA
jgi:hypothetical protein